MVFIICWSVKKGRSKIVYLTRDSDTLFLKSNWPVTRLLLSGSNSRLIWDFLAHLSRRLIGELIVYQWLRRLSGVPRPSTFSNIFSSELNSYFIWRLLRVGKRRFVQMVLVTWLRWPPRPYMVKTLQKSPEPEGWWPWDLVCSIGVVGPTQFVQIMNLGWPWPT